MKQHPIEYIYQLIKIAPLAKDIYKVTLAPENQQVLQYQAGQYVKCYMPESEPCILSIANRPQANRELSFHLKVGENHSQTQKFFNYINTQKIICLQGPFGSATLPKQCKNKPLLFIAGGTGFSQIKVLLEETFYQQHKQPIHLVWGLTCEHYEYDKDWLRTVQRKHPNFNYHKVIWKPQQSNSHVPKGLVHEYIQEKFKNLNDYIIFASGPYQMVLAIKNLFDSPSQPTNNLISDMI